MKADFVFDSGYRLPDMPAEKEVETLKKKTRP